MGIFMVRQAMARWYDRQFGTSPVNVLQTRYVHPSDGWPYYTLFRTCEFVFMWFTLSEVIVSTLRTT